MKRKTLHFSNVFETGLSWISIRLGFRILQRDISRQKVLKGICRMGKGRQAEDEQLYSEPTKNLTTAAAAHDKIMNDSLTKKKELQKKGKKNWTLWELNPRPFIDYIFMICETKITEENVS
jgi:hypothetical protein